MKQTFMCKFQVIFTLCIERFLMSELQLKKRASIANTDNKDLDQP